VGGVDSSVEKIKSNEAPGPNGDRRKGNEEDKPREALIAIKEGNSLKRTKTPRKSHLPTEKLDGVKMKRRA